MPPKTTSVQKVNRQPSHCPTAAPMGAAGGGGRQAGENQCHGPPFRAGSTSSAAKTAAIPRKAPWAVAEMIRPAMMVS